MFHVQESYYFFQERRAIELDYYHQKLSQELSNYLRLGNLKEISEMLGIDGKVLNRQPKKKILTVMLQNCKKSAVKHSIEKLMSLNFLGLSTIICSRL